MSKKSNIQTLKSVFCWQGLRLELPPRWNPVKLEGDYNRGHALFADLHRPRLGLRWQRPRGRRFDPKKWTQQLMQEEVGMLAAEEAVPFEMPGGEAAGEQGMSGDGVQGLSDEDGDHESLWQGSLLYIEPEPPGRDVWLGRSRVSGRAVQVAHHAHRREQLLANQILPSLRDLPLDQPQPWSVFELSCVVPAGLRLEQHQLNAGDLTLRFTGKRQELIVRQVAVAQLALKRMELKQWLAQQMRIHRRHFRVIGEPEETTLVVRDGRKLLGVRQTMRRRRRFFWTRWMAAEVVSYVLHDESRDRLVLVQASDDATASEVAATMGWAATYES